MNRQIWALCVVAALATVGMADWQFRPADYTVLSCYPNPFNSTARIRYDILQPGRVELKLYDLQGRLVKSW